MVSRISDTRLLKPDPSLACMIDLVCACVTDRDLDFMFPELSHIADATWRVPVDLDRALRFDMAEGLGAINIRLE